VHPLLRSTVVVAACVLAGSAAATASSPSWSHQVTGICEHALLFEGTHEGGTRAGALAVARDIRASTGRRLLRIRALEVVPSQPRLANRWLGLEQRLAATYATNYVRIFDAIDAANTPRQRERLPAVLRRLLDAPNGLRRKTAGLEQRLHVPDCTGGTPDTAGHTFNP